MHLVQYKARSRKITTKRVISVFILLSVVMLTACGNNNFRPLPVVTDYMPDTITETTHLRIGVVSGPYQGMFEEAVLPSLQNIGYTATFFYFNDYTSPNFALAQNEIGLNIFQHYVYLNTFKFENDLALSAIMEIPTVSMRVFSNIFSSISDISSNVSVSIPNDPSNLARALRVLENANLVTLDPAIDKLRATINDIVENPYNLRFAPMPAHELVESLKVFDIAVINGNYAVSGGLNLSEALFHEILVADYMNVIAVRTDDLSKQFVRDIIDVIYSESFLDIIADPDGNFVGFQWPRWFHDALAE